MQVKCILDYPTADHISFLGDTFYRAQRFFVTVGRSYLVLGLSFHSNPTSIGRGLIFQIEDDDGDPSFLPACLFQVTDPRASRYWELRVKDDGTTQLWPPSFFRRYYHDDLSEGVKEIVEDYKHVVSRLRSESMQDDLVETLEQET